MLTQYLNKWPHHLSIKSIYILIFLFVCGGCIDIENHKEEIAEYEEKIEELETKICDLENENYDLSDLLEDLFLFSGYDEHEVHKCFDAYDYEKLIRKAPYHIGKFIYTDTLGYFHTDSNCINLKTNVLANKIDTCNLLINKSRELKFCIKCTDLPTAYRIRRINRKNVRDAKK